MHIWVKPQVCINSSKWMRAQDGKKGPKHRVNTWAETSLYFSNSHTNYTWISAAHVGKRQRPVGLTWWHLAHCLPCNLGTYQTCVLQTHYLKTWQPFPVFTVLKWNLRHVGPPWLIWLQLAGGSQTQTVSMAEQWLCFLFPPSIFLSNRFKFPTELHRAEQYSFKVDLKHVIRTSLLCSNSPFN